MYIVRGLTAIFAGLILLALSWTTPQTSEEVTTASAQQNMTVLYNGQGLMVPTFGVESWVAGVTGHETVDITNNGHTDFTATIDSGPKQPYSLAYHTQATVTLLSGDVLYEGLYSDMEVTDLHVPAGETLTVNVDIQWNPPADFSYEETFELLGLNTTAK